MNCDRAAADGIDECGWRAAADNEECVDNTRKRKMPECGEGVGGGGGSSSGKNKTARDVHEEEDEITDLLTGCPLQNLVKTVGHHLVNKRFSIRDDFQTLPLTFHVDHKSFDQIDEAIETASEFVDSTNLECKFLALNEQLFVAYIYFNFAANLFNTKFTSLSETYELCKSFLLFDDSVLMHVAFMHSLFQGKPSYNIYVKNMVFPWNDRVLPRLHRELDRKKREMSALGCGVRMSLTSPTLPTVSLFDTYEREVEIRKIAKLYSSLYTNDALRALESTRDSAAVKKFVENTFTRAPCFNGVACSGKTTILAKLLDTLKTIDPNADVLKVGSLGTFVGKDDNQVLAMGYQYVNIGCGYQMYTSIFDRCMFNNLIWRIVLKMMDTREDMVNVFIRELQDVSPYMIELMSKEPVIVFVDTNVLDNRCRMSQRDSGGDCYRCMIENYTPAQNIVYGVFAYLCNWPLFNRGGSLGSNWDGVFELLKTVVVEKVESNIRHHDGRLPGTQYNKHRLCASGNVDTVSVFDAARDVKIFK